MDPRLTIACGNAVLSVAEELFAAEDKWKTSGKESLKLVYFLVFAIGCYANALSDKTLEEELRGEAEANLQKAQDTLHALKASDLEALKEYLTGETIPLDEMLKDEEC